MHEIKSLTTDFKPEAILGLSPSSIISVTSTTWDVASPFSLRATNLYTPLSVTETCSISNFTANSPYKQKQYFLARSKKNTNCYFFFFFSGQMPYLFHLLHVHLVSAVLLNGLRFLEPRAVRRKLGKDVTLDHHRPLLHDLHDLWFLLNHRYNWNHTPQTCK